MNLTPFTSLFIGVYAVLMLSQSAYAGGKSEPWWDKEWPIRKKIILDTTAEGGGITEAIGSAAVLLRLSDGNFQFAAAKEDASDVRFVAEDGKTLLPFHIEKYDALMSEAFVWVRVPDLKPNAKTSFWLYYGNPGPKAVRVDDPKATFDAETVLVYHFAENNVPHLDSSGSNNNAQAAGPKSEGALIGAGLRLTGQSTVTVPAAPSLAWADGAAVTLSAWIKPTLLQPNAILFSRRDDTRAFVIGLDQGVPFVEITGASGTERTKPGAPLAINTWRHLAVAADGGKLTVYLDGIAYATLATRVPALNSPLLIGGDTAADPAAAPAGFTGELDELQLSNATRPPGFLRLAAIGQGPDNAAKLLAFQDDEQTKSWLDAGYFGVILKSVTVDGWVVIAILGVMAVVSWLVMFGKSSYLNAVSKGNAEFMKNWHHIASDLTALDHTDTEQTKNLGGRVDKKKLRAVRKAPIYRIYHTGVEEIRHRLANAGGARVISPLSIEAIRATLDGALVRETQRLNSQIVYLTLSIAGGPFLGLLGTVVGVMITFAAIAAAGDVNVNAIAPGIAAALVATVAGLAVAIPALFGYNYLLTRIKDATSDMHVFIDEFITKMAEFYASGGNGDPGRSYVATEPALQEMQPDFGVVAESDTHGAPVALHAVAVNE